MCLDVGERFKDSWLRLHAPRVGWEEERGVEAVRREGIWGLMAGSWREMREDVMNRR